MSPTTKRRTFLAGVGALLLAVAVPALADKYDEVTAAKHLRIAVYNNYPPYSADGHGIDVELGEALAAKLGLTPEIVWFTADDDMKDDLRNMVWKGHYLGRRPADVMMHVPVDERFSRENEQVRIFGTYHLETMAAVRNPARVGPFVGSAAVALEVFTREKIGVELATLPDAFLLGALNGRIRDNVVHYRSVALAVKGLQAGEVAAVMAPRAELEAAVGKDTRYPVEQVKMPELHVDGWALGMAVKADSPRLEEALDKAMGELHRDGTVGRIFARYGVTHHPPGS